MGYRAQRPPTFAACIPRVEEARERIKPREGRYLPELTPERLLMDRSDASNPQTQKRCLPP